MKIKETAVIIIGLLIKVIVLSAFGQWEQTNGPCGGSFEALATQHDTVLYTSVFGKGVYRTTDAGETWTAVNDGLTHKDIFTLASTGDNLFAGTEFNGIYIYSKSTGRWTQFESKVGNSYERILNMVARENAILLTTDEGLVRLYSKDGDWYDSLINPTYSSNDVAFTDGYLWLSARNLLVRSADNGVTWDTCTTGLPQNAIAGFIMLDDTLGFVSIDNIFYMSGNAGAAWDTAHEDPGGVVREFAARNDTIVCAYADRVGISTDRGATWTDFSSGYTFENCKEIAIIGTTVFLATSKGIFKAAFTDRAWEDISNGIVSATVSTLQKVGETIFAGGDGNGKVNRSVDGGMNWTVSDSGFDRLTKVNTLTFFDSSLYAGGEFQYLMQSTDLGRSWTECNYSVDNVLSFHQIDKRLLLGHNILGIFMLDAGETAFRPMLEEINFGIEPKIDEDCGCAMPYPVPLSYAELDGKIFTALYMYGLYYMSKDSGMIWYPVTGLTDTAITAVYAANGSIFAYSSDNGMYLSVNRGVTWSSSETKFTGIPVFAHYGAAVFVGTEDGVSYSIDSGVTWGKWEAGFNEPVKSLLVDENGEYLLAGTASSGVWRRHIGEYRAGVANPHMRRGEHRPFVAMQQQGNTISCRFTLPCAERVTIALYNLQGKSIAVLKNTFVSCGKHVVRSDMSTFGAGYYIVRFDAGSLRSSMPFIISGNQHYKQ